MTEGSRNLIGVSLHSVIAELQVDVRFLDELEENVQHAVNTPGTWVLAQKGFVLWPALGFVSGCRELLELVNELIDYVPQPLIWELKLNWLFRF